MESDNVISVLLAGVCYTGPTTSVSEARMLQGRYFAIVQRPYLSGMKNDACLPNAL